MDCKGNFPHFAELEVGSYWMGVVATYQPQTSLELHKWNAIYIPKFVCRLLLFLSYLCLKSLGVKTWKQCGKCLLSHLQKSRRNPQQRAVHILCQPFCGFLKISEPPIGHTQHINHRTQCWRISVMQSIFVFEWWRRVVVTSTPSILHTIHTLHTLHSVHSPSHHIICPCKPPHHISYPAPSILNIKLFLLRQTKIILLLLLLQSIMRGNAKKKRKEVPVFLLEVKV